MPTFIYKNKGVLLCGGMALLFILVVYGIYRRGLCSTRFAFHEPHCRERRERQERRNKRYRRLLGMSPDEERS